jgi:hypothetical protein
MTPSYSNAFREPEGDKQRQPGSKQLSSAVLSSMTVTLRETDYGWSLKLSPMRAFDALRIWPTLTSNPAASSLLYDVTLDAVRLSERPATRMPHDPAMEDKTVSELADQLGINIMDRFAGERLVLDELSLRELVGMTNTRRMRCALVEGPIEARDAEAIAEATRRGHCPLEAEFRAVAAIAVDNDRHITLDTRSREHAIRLAAENFRHYLAAIRDRPFDEFAAPQDWQIGRLLEVSGSLTVRPIETDVFSTSIDVGVSTTAVNQPGQVHDSGPADQSLIYDLPSHTWHDEP